ncbi:MAG: hypothetical protein ACYS9V_13935, partial [Planctomycetota bacterium]
DDKELWITASENETENIIESFQQIQSHIREKNYNQAWQCFTKEYQIVEYNDDLDRFKEAMRPESMLSIYLWNREEFLSLQSMSISKSNDLYTLTASCLKTLWTIDFTLIEGQWKIDWIGGYIPPFVEQ